MKNDEIRQLCDNALADYDFGEGVFVEATSGWRYESSSSEVTCSVFLRFEEDDKDEDSHLATFSVTVVNGKITQADCSWNGEFIGTQFVA
jgi:hypothetical protein